MSATTAVMSEYTPRFFQSGGFGAEVEKLAKIAYDFNDYLSDAYVAYGPLNEISRAIDDAAASAQTADWDGENGLPVDKATVIRAKQFASTLPTDIRVPEIYPDSRGELTFEWRNGKGRIVSVSIYPNGTIGYASLIGTSKSYGNEFFVSAVPATLLRLIARVYA